MKKHSKLVLIIVTLFLALNTGCSNNTGQNHMENSQEHSHSGNHDHKHQHKQMHSENMQMSEHNQETPEIITANKNSKIAPAIDAYLKLKNALVNGDQQSAAEAAKQLLEQINQIESNSDELKEILEDAKEQAEHIAKSEIDHQREHLQMLSEDMKDLIKIVGTDRELYVTFCPMANDGQGAIWISETKTIKNPYYGEKMLTCGSVKEVLTYEEKNN